MSAIVVALPKLEDAKRIRKILTSHGFSGVFAYSLGTAVLQEVNRHSNGIVICSYRLPDMYYRDLAENLPEYFELVLIGSANTIGETESGILALTTPLKVYDLVNTVEMIFRKWARRKKKKAATSKRSEREENFIRNAKMLLMERNHLSEQDAHRYIQKTSMDNGTNMVETAQMILTLLYEEG